MSRPNLAIVQQRGAIANTTGLNNLPAQPTPIIGREAEIDVLTQRLLQPDLRLITLIGPAGVGKTRLAVQVASNIAANFTDGVWFVGLSAIFDPGLVVPTIAQTLDLHASHGQPILVALREHLRDKSIMLILDNFEQVMPAGPALAELLSACPRIKLLVTSRSALHLRGEQEFPVPTLSLPDLQKKRLPDIEALQQYSAVALFGQRAASVRPDFTINASNAAAIVEICARLDGLPLAIELVAARVKLLQPQAIQQRLQHRLQLLTGGAQDLPVRQQTLRNAIEWSYDLLTEQEQTLFRRLSIFIGGCTLEAAEQILAVPDQSAIPDVLDGIGSLINKSLLRQVESDGESEPRYTMLETIREYAWEQLEKSSESGIMRDRHAAYFMSMAEEAEPYLIGATQTEYMNRLEREHDNFRAALKWCRIAETGATVGLRMVGALGRFWSVRDYLAEGRDWVDGALARPVADAPTPIRIKALYSGARLADNQGEYEAVRRYCHEVLTIQHEHRDKMNVAGSYILLAKAESNEGNYAEARTLLEEGLNIAREANDLHGIAHCLNGLGELERLQGDYPSARDRYEECLQLFRRMGNTNGIGFSLHNLSHVYTHDKEYERAQDVLSEGLALYRGLGNRLGSAMCVSALSGVAVNMGDASGAARLLGAAQSLLDSIGALLDPADLMEYKRNEQAAREKLGEAAFLAAWAEGRAMTPEQVVAIEDTYFQPVTQANPSGTQTTIPRVRATTPTPARPSTESPASAQLQTSADALSARETDVLRLIARGLTDADVAAQLYLSPHTVRAHLRNIYSKIGVTSRSAATRYAAENNIV